MRRLAVLLALVPTLARADAWDDYTNPLLAKAAREDLAKFVAELPSRQLVAKAGVVPGTESATLVVQTGTGRWAKLLAQPGRHKTAKGFVPYLIVDRFATYKEGTERQVVAAGRAAVFAGTQLNLDLGDVVPAELGGDVTVVADGERDFVVKAVGAAKLYLLEKPLPDAARPNAGKFVMGPKFDPKAYNGTFRLYDDGVRVGKLVLKVDGDGTLDGGLYSDRDGTKYDVQGRIGNPAHSFQFQVKYPRTEQLFTGFVFTGDGSALAGTSKMEGRDAGFYAVRLEE